MSDKLRRSMTYGVMPSFDEFAAAFDEECITGEYRISNLSRSDASAVEPYGLGDGVWSATELYQACTEIAEAYSSEAAMDLVSSIMYTLGFEWI